MYWNQIHLQCSNTVRFLNIECELLDKTYGTFEYCYLKLGENDKSYISLKLITSKMSLNNISVSIYIKILGRVKFKFFFNLETGCIVESKIISLLKVEFLILIFGGVALEISFFHTNYIKKESVFVRSIMTPQWQFIQAWHNFIED